MNKENVQLAINIMERAQKDNQILNMAKWQSLNFGEAAATTEQELIECGTAACFAGFVAISPEFRGCGGKVCPDGCPYFRGSEGSDAIAEWLNIGWNAAMQLCAAGDEHERVYGRVSVYDITIDAVLEALHRLKNTGTVYL